MEGLTERTPALMALITGGGRRIAAIGPVTASNGAEVVALLTSQPADEDFAADVLAIRDAVVLDGPVWPADRSSARVC